MAKSIKSSPSFFSHSQFIFVFRLILFNISALVTGISSSLHINAVPMVLKLILSPSSEMFINRTIISLFELRSYNHFFILVKSPLSPLLHIIDKYFLLFDNKATACLGFMSKFLHKDNIKNSRAVLQSL